MVLKEISSVSATGIEGGMITYKGLLAPLICDHMSRLQSRAHYPPETAFQIGRIEMVGNTGTYIDTPFHRYETGYEYGVRRHVELGPFPTDLSRAIYAAL